MKRILLEKPLQKILEKHFLKNLNFLDMCKRKTPGDNSDNFLGEFHPKCSKKFMKEYIHELLQQSLREFPKQSLNESQKEILKETLKENPMKMS